MELKGTGPPWLVSVPATDNPFSGVTKLGGSTAQPLGLLAALLVSEAAVVLFQRGAGGASGAGTSGRYAVSCAESLLDWKVLFTKEVKTAATIRKPTPPTSVQTESRVPRSLGWRPRNGFAAPTGSSRRSRRGIRAMTCGPASVSSEWREPARCLRFEWRRSCRGRAVVSAPSIASRSFISRSLARMNHPQPLP